MLLKKVTVLDKVNYFGLIEGDQILFCTDLKNDTNSFLWCLDKRSTVYRHSGAGEKCFDMSRFNNESNYYAEIKCIQIKTQNLSLWQKLFEEGLYPYWNPQDGPLKYHNPVKRIALCRVYELGFGIVKEDFGIGNVNRLLKNKEKIKSIGDLSRVPVLSDEDYNKQRNSILDILEAYDI